MAAVHTGNAGGIGAASLWRVKGGEFPDCKMDGAPRLNFRKSHAVYEIYIID